MIHREVHPKSYQEACDLLISNLSGVEAAVLQAGHFLLYYDNVEDRVLPCIAAELNGPRHGPLRDAMGGFPDLSWDVGLRLLREMPLRERRALVLVNDWQYVPSAIGARSFYESHRAIPRNFSDKLASSAFEKPISLISPANRPGRTSSTPYFSERALRRDFERRIETLSKTGTLPSGVVLKRDGDRVSCSLTDVLGRHEEVYCSDEPAGCAHEVSELLAQVWEQTKAQAFLSIFPSVCRRFVEIGTEQSALLGLHQFRVVFNLALAATDVQEEHDLWRSAVLTVHRFP